MSKQVPWGEAHWRESVAAIGRWMARLAPEYAHHAAALGERANHMIGGDEDDFRFLLGSVDSAVMTSAGLDVEREVRRVRGLAEGRLVRDVVWRRERDGSLFSNEDLALGGVEQPVTRVIRIRRA